MKSTAIPVKFPVVWGSMAGGAYIRTPVVTAPTGDVNQANLQEGFPPAGFGPGGAPEGKDMNGALFQVTGWNQWQQAGGAVPYDATFQTAISGYPKNCIVQSGVTDGLFWISTAEDNVTNPDTGGAGWAVFRSAASNAAPTVYLSGAGNYTVPAGVKRIYVQAQGDGGGGGGSGGLDGSAGGGGSGAYDEQWFAVSPGDVIAYSVGAGAAGGDNTGSNGANGAGTTFGTLSCSGGMGGTGSTGSGTEGIGGGPGAATGGLGINSGGWGFNGTCADVGGVNTGHGSGNGGASFFGGGGKASSVSVATPTARGSGGGGAYNAALAGGAGAPGIIIVRVL